MNRWKQYGGLVGLLVVCFGAGLWGFTSTGGALPWAKRSAQTLQRGVQEGGGTLIDFGRGIVVAGPIRKGGMMLEYTALVVIFALVGIGLYVYADRYHGLDEQERAAK
jgi:uncharacterized membrane protein